jgi:hypothetical protein
MKHIVNIQKLEAKAPARKLEIAARVAEMNARHEAQYAALQKMPNFPEIQEQGRKAMRYILSPKFTKVCRIMQGC